MVLVFENKTELFSLYMQRYIHSSYNRSQIYNAMHSSARKCLFLYCFGWQTFCCLPKNRQCAIIHCRYNSYDSYKYLCKYLRLQKSIEIFPRESEYSLGKILDVLWPESALPTLLLDSPFLKILMDLLG